MISFDRIGKKELGYIIGLYIGDGYSNYNRKDRHYTVEFTLNSVRDTDIVSYLLDLLILLGLNPFLIKDKRYKAVKIKVNSKDFMHFILECVDKLDRKEIDKDKDYMLGLIS